MLLHSLTHVSWKKSTFCLCYLHNNITMLLIRKIENKASTSEMFLINFFVHSLLYSFSLWMFHFFFINGIFKTLIAQSSLEAYFFIKNCLQMYLYSNVYDERVFRNKSEQKRRVPDKYYISNDHANVINFRRVTSNLTKHKKRRKTKE